MAVAASKPSTISAVSDTIALGNRKMRTRRLTFSGNYATGGETIAASLFGFRKIEQLITPGGMAMASALSTGIPCGWDAANSKLVFFEGSAAGTALSEKTNAEAYPTGCFRCWRLSKAYCPTRRTLGGSSTSRCSATACDASACASPSWRTRATKSSRPGTRRSKRSSSSARRRCQCFGSTMIT